MPNELYMLQMLSGGVIDTWGPLVAMLGLLAVGLVYFVAPAIGYTTYNRGLLLGAMWVLIARLTLGIFRSGMVFLATMDQPSGGGPFSSSSSSSPMNMMMMSMLFGMLESGLFILAMALFAGGLGSLRREPDHRRDLDLGREPDVRRAQPPRFPND